MKISRGPDHFDVNSHKFLGGLVVEFASFSASREVRADRRRALQ